MDDYGRRIVIDLKFPRALGEAVHAICDEGLQVIARIDVRDHFRRSLRRDFRQYVLLQVWSSELAFHVLQHHLEAGTILPTTIAIYELADGETAVVANEPLSSLVSDPAWRREAPELAVLADRESDRIARVLTRLQRSASGQATVAHAA